MITTTETVSKLKVTIIKCPSCGSNVRTRMEHLSPSIVCSACLTVFNHKQLKMPAVITDEVWDATEVSPKKKRSIKTKISLGKKGKLKGVDYEVVGCIKRLEDDTTYSWVEYLLYNPYKGFVWLTEHSDHWNFVRTLKDIPVHQFKEQMCWSAENALKSSSQKRDIHYLGNKYKLNRSYAVKNDSAAGEFYFKPNFKTKHTIKEYVCNNQIITHETNNTESIWSIAEYMYPEVIEKAFDVKLALPATISANQVLRGKRYSKPIALLSSVFVILLMAYLFVMALMHPKDVLIDDVVSINSKLVKIFYFQKHESLVTDLKIGPQKPYAEHNSVQVDGGKVTYHIKNLKNGFSRSLLTLKAPELQNQWVSAQIDFINQKTGKVITQTIGVQNLQEGPITYHNNSEAKLSFPALQKGDYTVTVSFSISGASLQKVQLKLVNNTTQRNDYLIFILLALAFPTFILIRSTLFNIRCKLDGDGNTPIAKFAKNIHGDTLFVVITLIIIAVILFAEFKMDELGPLLFVSSIFTSFIYAFYVLNGRESFWSDDD